MAEQSFIPAVRADAIAPGQAAQVRVGGRDVLVCHADGRFFAVANRCSHADEALACGRIRNGWIACPAHGARFDLATGEALGPPAEAPIETFALRVNDGMIELAIA